ncbi:hypothetical protein BMG00_17320 [Thioclava marina]|uniref:Glycosyltransferase 2-like domain-containing protein n=1 Tax=Thioclava marina TaxID=1915077 RepID=A0ABX3MHI8_9RHOB|nr:glycosyltransferase [Thioclava marina]OOY10916.1 hypothetical protein BMG00_17320 [Thioclava marina]
MNAILSHPIASGGHGEPRRLRMSRPRALIVVPCYNEAERFNHDAFAQFIARHNGVDFVFVNDGSTDATEARLEALRAEYPQRVTVLRLSRNSGKAEAVRQGLLHACGRGVSHVGYWDADLATPLDAIPDFLRVIDRDQDVQVVYGARLRMLGRRVERRFSRRIVSAICATLARQVLSLPIGDSQCGAKMLRNTPSLCLALSEPFNAGWLFDVELFLRLKERFAAIESRHAFFEQPLVEWDEVPGSKVSGNAILRSGMEMLKLLGRARLGLNFSPKPTAAPVTATVCAPAN